MNGTGLPLAFMELKIQHGKQTQDNAVIRERVVLAWCAREAEGGGGRRLETAVQGLSGWRSGRHGRVTGYIQER